MSDPVQAERVAFRELESVMRNLAEELASFRRRALTAEARLKEIEGRDASGAEVASAFDRVTELEHQNAALRTQLEQASARARQMLERVRFLRQQAKTGGDK